MYKDANLTLQVRDFEKMLKFYVDLLGLRLRYRNRDQWAEANAGGLTIGFTKALPDAPAGGAGGNLSIGLTVEKLEEAVSTLGKKGIAFSQGISETPAARLAFFTDPEGNPIYLCELETRV